MGCLLQVEQWEAHEFSETNAIMLLNEHTVCTKNLAFHFHPIVQISRRVPKAVKICFRTTPTSAGCYQALPTTLAALPGTKIDLKYRCPGVPRSSTMLGKCFIFHGQSHGHFMGISGTGTLFWGQGFIIVPIKMPMVIFQLQCCQKWNLRSWSRDRWDVAPSHPYQTKTDIPAVTFVIPMRRN